MRTPRTIKFNKITCYRMTRGTLTVDGSPNKNEYKDGWRGYEGCSKEQGICIQVLRSPSGKTKLLAETNY